MASAPPLYWGMDGSKCSVGAAGEMEKDQLSAQRETFTATELWQDITAWVEKLAVKVHHEMHMCPRVVLWKNTTMDKWIVLPRVKCLRWIWTDNMRGNYFWLAGPMTPQVIGEEMKHPDGLMD